MAAYLGYGARPSSPGFVNTSAMGTPLVASTVGPVLTSYTPGTVGGAGYGGYVGAVPPIGYGRPASPSVVTTETTTISPQGVTTVPVIGSSVGPVLTGGSFMRPVSPSVYPSGTISGSSRLEYVPYSKKVIDYETREWSESIPKQRVITEYQENRWIETIPRRVDTTDYYAIETVRQYVPEVIPEITVETMPVERSVFRTEYIPIERKITHLPSAGIMTGASTLATNQTVVSPAVYTATVPEIVVPTDISGYGNFSTTGSFYQQPGYAQGPTNATTYQQTTSTLAPAISSTIYGSSGYNGAVAGGYGANAYPGTQSFIQQQTYPSQGYPAQGYAAQGYPTQGYAQGYPQGYPQGYAYSQQQGQVPLYN